MKPPFPGLNDFAKGYITAAFWTFDEDAPIGEYSTSGRPEVLYADLDDKALQPMLADCLKFQAEQGGHLRLSGLPDSEAGHLFWLTRNRHGSGFWDADIPQSQQDALTKAAHAFGESVLYTTEDGQIYLY